MGYSGYDESALKDYLTYDMWDVASGLGVLTCHTYPYAGKVMEECNLNAFPEFAELCVQRYGTICGIWENSKLDFSLGMALHINSDQDYYAWKFPPEYFIDWALSKRFRPDWLDWAIEQKLYTPKELRNLPAPPSNTPAAPDYHTAWLTIQQAAITEFFNPRRNPDAKKEEVVAWIKSQALAAKLPDSNNVVSTIFTIIKPENHDPKKKRVEPQ